MCKIQNYLDKQKTFLLLDNEDVIYDLDLIYCKNDPFCRVEVKVTGSLNSFTLTRLQHIINNAEDMHANKGNK